MDKERMREILDICGWSQGFAAKAMHHHERFVRAWAAGKNPIDPDVAAWLEHQAKLPPPGLKFHQEREENAARGPIERFSR